MDLERFYSDHGHSSLYNSLVLLTGLSLAFSLVYSFHGELLGMYKVETREQYSDTVCTSELRDVCTRIILEEEALKDRVSTKQSTYHILPFMI
jgi:hypothetical protein